MNAAGEAAGAVGAGGAGALIGGMLVRQAGMTAAGMVGGGAGVGFAAGPVGAALGALAGLAAYGACRVVRDVVEANAYEVTYVWCMQCGHGHYEYLGTCADYVAGKPCPCEFIPPFGEYS
jgi:hypothetical protein